MHGHTRRLLTAFSVVAVPLATSFTYAQTRSTSGLELTALNRSADPCTDFYQFACGGWLAANPIPADRARWGRFDELREKNLEILRRVLEQAASGRDAATKKIGDYYATCMDEATINRRGATPLEPDLRNIAAVQSVDRLPELLAELHETGVTALFGFGAEGDFEDTSRVIAVAAQGGMGLPDRDYYFRDDARSVEIRKQYQEHIATPPRSCGSKAPSPKRRSTSSPAATRRISTTR
jgi:endothelin-converting enzyme/putative endopeptidase